MMMMMMMLMDGKKGTDRRSGSQGRRHSHKKYNNVMRLESVCVS